ncbi:MAG TPA: glycosyltransferase family 2 protein [Candidatus Nanopelagicales bacterium]
MPVLTVVSPFYNEELSIGRFLERLRAALDPMGVEYEVLLVDDGSTDSTLRRLRDLDWPECRVLCLGRNFGHQAAIEAGLAAASGDYVVTLDSDGQHPPELVPDMLRAARDGEVDVVYMVRSQDAPVGVFKKATSRLFYRLVRWSSGLELKDGQADFRLVSAQVRQEVLDSGGPKVLRVLIPSLNFPSVTLVYDEEERIAGTSKYTLRKMGSLAWTFVLDSSALPLRLASLLAVVMSAVSIVWVVAVLVTYALQRTIEGWASVMTAILVLGAVTSVLLAVQGQYLARMYEWNLNRNRPRVRRTVPLTGARRVGDDVDRRGSGVSTSEDESEV